MSATNFFISYNRADKQWAEWIAWTLEEAGQTVSIQAWDFRPGGNFVLDMQRAAAASDKTIAVLSESYLKSSFTQPEWAAAFVDDPQSLNRKLLPVRVKACQPTGLLKPIVYVDLVGLSQAEAKTALLEALRERVKPDHPPVFPGSETVEPQALSKPKYFPKALNQVQQLKAKTLQERLNCLASDYEAIAQQLTYTTNAVDRNALTRQQDAISQNLEQVATDLNALEVPGE